MSEDGGPDGVAGMMERAKARAIQNVEHLVEDVAAETLTEGQMFQIAQTVGERQLSELTVTDTTCGYCAVGCRFDVYADEEEVLAVRPTDPEKAPVNGISTCVKGKFSYGFVGSDDRVTEPLVRGEDGEFREATWAEAYDRVVDGLRGVQEEHGEDAVSMISSSKATNEENYLMQKFARQVLGTNNIDNCNRLCHAPTVEGLATVYGYGASSVHADDYVEADCILLTGSNTTEAHPVLATRIKQNVRDGADLLVFDPREVQIAEYATQYTRVEPGYDAAWINGITRHIVENELYDEEFVAERTTGFDDVAEAVSEFTPERVERATGVPPEDIASAAETIAAADRCLFGWTLGLTEHSHGTENVTAMANLVAITGNLGKPGTGVSPFRGQNNVQGGGGDMGPLPNCLPGYQDVADDELRGKFEAAYDCEIPAEYGYRTTDMFLAGERGDLRGMYVIGENVAVSEPNVGHAEEVLADLDFLVVQELFHNETTPYADVVLPACSFVEKTGTFTNTTRRVQLVKKAMEPKGNSKPDWVILTELAGRMGYEWGYEDTAEIMREVNSLTPLYGGVTHERVEAEGGLQWPCWDEDHPGTKRLYSEEFNTPDGRANLTPVGFSEPAETPDDRYPLTLTTGRVLYQYHTGTMTHPEEGIMEYVDGDFVEVNPETAAEAGVTDGELARVESRRGGIAVPVQVTDRPGEGTVFVPMHFAETAVNVLTAADHRDEPSGTPEYKVTSVRIAPFDGDEPGILFKNRSEPEPTAEDTPQGTDVETSADD